MMERMNNDRNQFESQNKKISFLEEITLLGKINRRKTRQHKSKREREKKGFEVS